MRYFENLQKTAVNRLPGRSFYIPDGEATYELLNGTWRFLYCKDGDTLAHDAEVEKWGKITVPGCWQVQGYDYPNYTNTNYPYPLDPPYVPMENPAGMYEREFTVMDTAKQTYLVLEGVSSCASIYVNGAFAGYTQGSHLQAEFDITSLVKEGENTLRVVVRKWCCGSYLEDQDFFRFNGIFRDVYVLERPVGHLTDIDVRTENNSIVRITTAPGTEVELYDNTVLLDKIVTDQDGKASFSVENPTLWNAEKPYLYTLQLRKAGEVIEQHFGFRIYGVNDRAAITVNGVEVKLKGVNHHDSTPTAGWTMTDEEMIKDLTLMKELNINTIRTSHYPPPPRFLDYCDKMGFYVVLETDLETHGFVARGEGQRYVFDVENPIWPCTNPEWKNEYVSRMTRAYERDKNHSSIMMWSVGNECGFGENHKAMVAFIRSVDHTRLIHAEDASRALTCRCEREIEKKYDALMLARGKGVDVEKAEADYQTAKENYRKADEDQHLLDIYSRMYPSAEKTKNFAANGKIDQPIFLCEFAHASGGGPGDIWDYTEVFYSHPQIVGGCIWEWCDHAVLVDGVYRYGGDFPGELTHDSNYCCDGIVFPDRSFYSGTYEVKTAYAPFRFTYKDGIVTVENRFDFTNLKDCDIIYSLMADGTVMEQRSIKLDVKPHESGSFKVGASFPNSCQYGCFINVTLSDTNGKEYGTLQQNAGVPLTSILESGKEAKLTDDGRFVTASGERFTYRFDKSLGNLCSVVLDGKEQLRAPVSLSAFHAPTDNERSYKDKWLHNGQNLDHEFNHVYEAGVKDNVIRFVGSLAGISRTPFFRYTLEIVVFDNGTLKYTLDGGFNEKKPCWFPRLGFEFSLKKKNAQFEYFGMGPMDNYSDLCHFSTVDWYKSTAAEEYVPHILPQEHGNHTGVRELDVDNKLFFKADTEMQCNVSLYDTKQLFHATHTDEIGKSNGTHVRIDYRDAGLGSSSVGPDLPHEHRLEKETVHFAFTMSI